MKKLFTLFFALTCATSIFAYDCKIQGIYYNINESDKTATVTYKEQDKPTYSGSIVIPNAITYHKQSYSVTTIGKEAFYWCEYLTSVTIGNSVTTIGESAFSWCFGLTSVTIPNSVTTIGESAFSDCSGLTSVTIPNSVKTIGTSAFFDVANIVYNGTATGSPWGAKCVNGFVDGYLVYSDNSKTTLLVCSRVATGDIVIPNSVTTIGKEAFYDCDGLTSVTIPNSVTTIGERTFAYCRGLTSVTIPRSVTTIGYWAFRGCSGLTSVTILNPNIKISKDAFNGCTITDFYCGKTVDLSTVRVTIQNIHRLNDEE